MTEVDTMRQWRLLRWRHFKDTQEEGSGKLMGTSSARGKSYPWPIHNGPMEGKELTVGVRWRHSEEKYWCNATMEAF